MKFSTDTSDAVDAATSFTTTFSLNKTKGFFSLLKSASYDTISTRRSLWFYKVFFYDEQQRK